MAVPGPRGQEEARTLAEARANLLLRFLNSSGFGWANCSQYWLV